MVGDPYDVRDYLISVGVPEEDARRVVGAIIFDLTFVRETICETGAYRVNARLPKP